MGHLSLLNVGIKLILSSPGSVEQYDTRLLAERDTGHLCCFFFFCQETIYRNAAFVFRSLYLKVVWSLSSFVSIDCIQNHDISRFVKAGNTAKTFPE